jgi:hypothetical protein
MGQVEKPQREREAAVIELHTNGMTHSAIAQELGVSRERVKQILDRVRREERRRGQLVERYGPRPDIAALPDDTPIDVLELCDGDIHGWAARISHLKHSQQNPIGTLGDLRRVSDRLILKEPNLGKKMLSELRRFCPSHRAKEEAHYVASTRETAGRALGSLRRAIGAIEEVQRCEIGADAAAAPRTKWLLADARAELGKAIALVERLRAASASK